MSLANLPMLHILKKSLFHKIELKPSTIQQLKLLNGFIFQYYTNGQKGLMSKIRIARILILYKQISHENKKIGKARNIQYLIKARKKLYRLLIG